MLCGVSTLHYLEVDVIGPSKGNCNWAGYHIIPSAPRGSALVVLSVHSQGRHPPSLALQAESASARIYPLPTAMICAQVTTAWITTGVCLDCLWILLSYFRMLFFHTYLILTIRIMYLSRALELSPLGSLFFLLFVLTEGWKRTPSFFSL